MASSSTTQLPEPIVVFYKSSMCRHCNNLTAIWDKVQVSLKEVYPKLRFFVLLAKDNSGTFDENTAPKDIIRYGKWYPMILLIPGPTWDAAMANLGPKNPIEIKDGVQIMNATWDKGQLAYTQKYDIRKTEEFAKWLKDSLENEDFKRVQSGNVQSGAAAQQNKVVVPTQTQSPAQPIPPLLSGIMRPGNTNANYVGAGAGSTTKSEGSDRHSAMEPGGDICSMRIISRPR